MPHDFIQWSIQAAGIKDLAGLYLLTTLPPIRIPVLENVVRRSLKLSFIRGWLPLTVS
jgi:hypothetical protein